MTTIETTRTGRASKSASSTRDYRRAQSLSSSASSAFRSNTGAYAPAAPGKTAGPDSLKAKPSRYAGGRLGSKQQVSVRGRRIEKPNRASSRVLKISLISLFVTVGGIALAMWLSGLATEQSFKLSQIQEENSLLDAQIVSMERELANKQSSGSLAAQAAELGMVVPKQPGIITPEEGGIKQLREAKADTAPVVDLNGNISAFVAPSSDPSSTTRVEGLAPEDPADAAAHQNANENPYPGGRPAQSQQLPPLPSAQEAAQAADEAPSEDTSRQDDPADAALQPASPAPNADTPEPTLAPAAE